MTMQIVGWAIIHSIWQGGIIAALVALAFAVTRRRSAVTRYSIGLTGLALMVALPIATSLEMSRSDDFRQTVQSVLDATPAPSPATLDDAPASASPSPSASVTGSGITITADEPAPAGGSRIVEFMFSPRLAAWIVVAWLVGLLIASAQLIGGLARTRRLTRDGTSPASPTLSKLVESVAQRLQIGQRLQVLESIRVDVPLVVGVLRPIIVVPASLMTGVAPWQIEMLLAHELAHVRRYDFLVNLAQTVIETLLFYHPAARWLSERIREERENCCDDVAIAVCGGNAKGYTETLLVLEESRWSDLGLAAAANGGSLLRRARRLLTGEPAHVELGPRWIAGIITIAAALFTGNEAMGSGIQASLVPPRVVAAESDDRGETQRPSIDPLRAAPSTVVRAPAGGSLADRVRWADQKAREFSGRSYWLGYVVAGDPSPKGRHYSDDVPVHIGKNSSFNGHMKFGDGDLSEFRFHGVPLTPLIGSHAPNSTAVFVLFDRSTKEVQRLRSASFVFPVHFDKRPLAWLDSASDSESVALLRSLLPRAPKETRSRLVGAVGVHRDARAAVPPLVEWVQSRTQPDDIRSEAAEWLGKQENEQAITVLARAVRTDRSKEVRESAIEAFSHMERADATDSLMAFASQLPDEDSRIVAIEALGHREDDRAVRFLVNIARREDGSRMSIEAIEALSESPGGRGFPSLIELVRSNLSEEARKEAVESLGPMEPASRALDILVGIAKNDRSEEVRAVAIETIAEVHDARSVTILRDLINSGLPMRLQLEATESLGETADPTRARAALRQIATTHPRDAVRGKAYETLANLSER